MKKRPQETAEDASIAAMDKFLADGGFQRARKPKGALARGREKRDARKRPKKALVAARKPLEVLRVPDWERPWLVHGFSTRSGGYSTVFGGRDLNLGMQKHDSRAMVEKNRKAFLAAVGADHGFNLVTLKQIHSSNIHVVEKASPRALTGDGVITNRPGLLLSIQTADCVPVLLVDMKAKAVGALHAGWRGTARRIAEKGIGMMAMVYGSDPADIHAAIGPCIQQCCYAVGPEVVDEFHSQFSYAKGLFKDIFDDDPVKTKYPLLFMTARAPGHGPVSKQPHLDLTEANRRQLMDAGVQPGNIWASQLCTGCHTDELFSHRKEDGFTGRMMAVVGMKR